MATTIFHEIVVATRLMCHGILNVHFIANLLLSMSVK